MSSAFRDEVISENAISARRLPSPSAATSQVFSRIAASSSHQAYVIRRGRTHPAKRGGSIRAPTAQLRGRVAPPPKATASPPLTGWFAARPALLTADRGGRDWNGTHRAGESRAVDRHTPGNHQAIRQR